MLRACCSPVRVRSVIERAVSRQASLNSSKRSMPSTSTSASLMTMSRYFWNTSSNSVTSMRPVRSSSVRMTRGPRFLTSSTSPATVTGLPPPKRDRLGARRRSLAHQVPDAVRGDTGEQPARMARPDDRSGTARASRARRPGARPRSTPAARRLARAPRPRPRPHRHPPAAGAGPSPNMSFWPASCALAFWSPSCMAAGRRCHERRAVRPECIEAAAADQRLQHAPVELLQVDPPAQILEARERAARLALRDQRLHRAPPHALHRAQAIADGRHRPHRELVAARR